MVSNVLQKIKQKIQGGKAGGNGYKHSSYSQSGEDLIARYIFNVLGIERPSYIDIGAHHPFFLSNTALFYENGSTGINVEPDPHLIQAFQQHRTRDTNLNIGISNVKSVLDFYVINDSVLNTFSKEEAENYYKEGDYRIVDTKKIEVDSLKSIIDQHHKGVFPDFLSLDVEGIDELVLRSLDALNTLPVVICVESISFSNKGKGRKNVELIDFVKSKGYIHYADTYINSIFVQTEKWDNQ